MNLQLVTVRDNDRQDVELTWQLADTVQGNGIVNVWHRPDGGSWSQLATVQRSQLTYVHDPANTTQQVNHYYLSLDNLCANTVTSRMHQTILLRAEADEAAETSRLNWTPYVSLPDSVKGYQPLQKLGDATGFSPSGDFLAANALNWSAKNASLAFTHCYRVEADNQQGLKSQSNTACIDFVNAIKTYNLITANGDGSNDNFYVKNATLYPNNTLRIYSRWGREVKKISNYQNDYSPTDLAAGTYFFEFDVSGKNVFKGWVEVVK